MSEIDRFEFELPAEGLDAWRELGDAMAGGYVGIRLQRVIKRIAPHARPYLDELLRECGEMFHAEGYRLDETRMQLVFEWPEPANQYRAHVTKLLNLLGAQDVACSVESLSGD